MSNLIDHTFFVGELNIPNTDRPDVQERLQYFIRKYEPMFLRQALGEALYGAFSNGLEEEPISVGWGNLKARLVLEDGDFKYSPIAAYVYYWYMRDQATVTTGVGEAVPNTDNAQRASAMQKMVSAWNEMCYEVASLHTFLNASPEVYQPWDSKYSRGAFITWCSPINTFNL